MKTFIVVSYGHYEMGAGFIVAEDLESATAIAKENPLVWTDKNEEYNPEIHETPTEKGFYYIGGYME